MSAGQYYVCVIFGRITLIDRIPGRPGYWKGRCSCGTPVEKRIDNLKRPGEHSCGMCRINVRQGYTQLAERLATLEIEVRGLKEKIGDQQLNQDQQLEICQRPSPSIPHEE